MSETVLIVDDSLTVRMDLAATFEAAGCQTFACASASEARKVLSTDHIDVIILDVQLPDVDGFAFLEEIRAPAEGSEYVVLMLSSEAEAPDFVRGMRLGADEYIGKPYVTGYVISRAHELCRSRQNISSEVTRVLVIEDSQTFREMIREACEGAGYEVLIASTGEEGLRVAASERPHAIIVDGNLPDLEGVAVIQRLRLDVALRSVPCLLLTGSQDDHAELLALEGGADAFVRKEEDVAVVLARLAVLVRQTSVSDASQSTRSLSGPKKILVVDDSPTFLNAVADRLQEEGYDVVKTLSGTEALSLVSVHVFDCILLDLVAPEMDGYEACKILKSMPVVRDVPLIMLTAVEDRAVMIRALAFGADDFVHKSGDSEVLVARIRAQIRRKQFEDENRRIREELLRREIETVEARAEAEIAVTRAALIDELELAREKADLANQAKSDFISRMSHELRTPLNAVLGFAQLLGHDDLTESQEESVNMILNGGRHLLDLINEVLDIARIESGKLALSLEPVHIEEITSEVLEFLNPIAADRSIRLELESDDACDYFVLADRQRLKQILLNLVSNAIKYNRSNGEVRISFFPTGGHLRVLVKDTGYGLTQAQLETAFEPFERLGADLTETEGTGVGLPLSRGLAEAMGGWIEASSAIGEGSTFQIILPLAGNHPIQGPIATKSRKSVKPTAFGQAATILYIEDNPSNQRLLERILSQREGLELLLASHGRLGVELARAQHPDLIFLDLHLPDEPGDQVLLRLRSEESTKDIPVVVLSADASTGQMRRLIAIGAYAYLTKPIEIDALLEVVDTVLALKSAGA